MPRPNLAQDAPPTAIVVGGAEYAVNVDYRVWIGVLRDLRELILNPDMPETMLKDLETIRKIETDVFGRVIDAPAVQVLRAINDFSKGYPEVPVGRGEGAQVQTYSFDWDLNYIILAIENQFRVDLSYRRKEPFHWWLFLLYFRALSGEHYILRLMEIRGYRGKDADMRKQARRFALPEENNARDRAGEAALKDIFYGC